MACPTCDPLWLKVALPVGGFVGGLLVNQFTLARKDRLTERQNRFSNQTTLIEAQRKAYDEYTGNLRKFADARKSGRTRSLFDRVAVSGDNYFRALRAIADAVLTGDVSPSVRDNTCMPLLNEAVDRSLPAHYQALQEMAEKNNIPYQGELRRENYESIYLAVEKFAHSLPVSARGKTSTTEGE